MKLKTTNWFIQCYMWYYNNKPDTKFELITLSIIMILTAPFTLFFAAPELLWLLFCVTDSNKYNSTILTRCKHSIVPWLFIFAGYIFMKCIYLYLLYMAGFELFMMLSIFSALLYLLIYGLLSTYSASTLTTLSIFFTKISKNIKELFVKFSTYLKSKPTKIDWTNEKTNE